jgi:hypothetical protein
MRIISNPHVLRILVEDNKPVQLSNPPHSPGPKYSSEYAARGSQRATPPPHLARSCLYADIFILKDTTNYGLRCDLTPPLHPPKREFIARNLIRHSR